MWLFTGPHREERPAPSLSCLWTIRACFISGVGPAAWTRELCGLPVRALLMSLPVNFCGRCARHGSFPSWASLVALRAARHGQDTPGVRAVGSFLFLDMRDEGGVFWLFPGSVLRAPCQTGVLDRAGQWWEDSLSGDARVCRL